MTELEKMQHARMYIQKLAEGIDPLTGRELPEDTLLNNVRLSRCFFYVQEVLGRVIENGGEVSRRGRESKPSFQPSPEELAALQPAGEPLPITKLCAHIGEACGSAGKLSYALVANWLASKGFLSEEIVNNSRRRRPSSQGRELGIFEESRTGPNGEYRAVLYTPGAQRFIIDNLPEIIASKDAWKKE